MTRQKEFARFTREVRIMFEPTRLAAGYLADAYVRLVPLVQRGVGTAPPQDGERGRVARQERREVQP
jgi:hypothetical protein